jgi:hypothetical protein
MEKEFRSNGFTGRLTKIMKNSKDLQEWIPSKAGSDIDHRQVNLRRQSAIKRKMESIYDMK